MVAPTETRWASISRNRRISLLTASMAAALVACMSFSAAARADLQVQHDSYTAAEILSPPSASDGDGIIGPGDSFSVTEKVHTVSQTPITHVTGVLQTTAPGVTVTQGSSAYNDLVFNVSTGNTTAFQAALSPTVDCGIVVPFTLQLSADQGTQSVPFSVQTGANGPIKTYAGTQLPQSIPDQGYVISRFNVPTPGRVMHMRVTLNSITHSYDGDLRIDLIAPDGTAVELVAPDSNNTGHDFTNTVFDDAAAPKIAPGGAPYTGTYHPAQWLSAFNGVQQQGTWQLKVTDTLAGNVGTLNSWGASVTPAVCTTQPIASFTTTPNPAAPGTSVSFDASGSVAPTPGATLTGYSWDFNGTGTWTTSTSSATATHVYSTRGTYNVGLRVTDSNGKTSTITQPLSITQAPVAAIQATPSSPVSAQSVTFDASGSTHDPSPGASIVDYKWDLDGSGNFATDTSTTPTVSTSYPTQRTVPVSVKVTDDVGATATATYNLTVRNAPPIAAFTGPTSVILGRSAAFDATGSHDIDGTIVNYSWDFNGSGSYATDTGSTPGASFTFTSPGVINVGLRVRDNDGATTQITHAIQVTRPPVAALKATPASPTGGQVVTLDASGSTDPDGAITGYAWDLDGSGQYATSTGSTPFLQHAFAPGTYQLSVRVTDNFGATATAPLTLIVAPASGSGGGAGPTTTGGGLLAQIGATVGGDPTAGIAALTKGDLQTIVAGSDTHFASITGAAVRGAAEVAGRGLWVNLLTDRPASFNLSLSIAAVDAKRLHISSVKRGTKPRRGGAGLRPIAAVAVKLTVAGQRPFDITLPAAVRSKLAKLRGRLQLVVTGSAVDAQGHRTALTRAFQVKR
jgi:subtilisin-like proprotein convertase family protein